MEQSLREFYANLGKEIKNARIVLARSLTLTEKILAIHCSDLDSQEWRRGESILVLKPDRAALQDATAQMAVLQFMQAMKQRVNLPTTIHCDHLIRAEHGAMSDLSRAVGENKEVYDFLSSAAAKYGMGFWQPGSGIIHQVVLENHAFPGGLLIGTDSHTPNAGGLSMIAIGVGGADAAEVMAGRAWEVLNPKIIGVHLTGSLQGWASPKDVITFLCTKLTVKGGTNKIIEYFGPGVSSISATGRATICNMGAELGATTSIFPCDQNTLEYLVATNRGELANLIDTSFLTADQEVQDNPYDYYDEVIEINLTEIVPWVVGPHSPDRGRPLSELAMEIENQGWTNKISSAMIGSCTNSSYEDISRAVNIVRQAIKLGLKLQVPLLITPGSHQIYQLMKKRGWIKLFQEVGANVLANACGPCIGQWNRRGILPNEENMIVSSYNRNFPGRNDGNKQTLSFITSPEIVVALAFMGHFTDEFPFKPPKGLILPVREFGQGKVGFIDYKRPIDEVVVTIPESSERLQLLKPFLPPVFDDFANLRILLKTEGKTTTDDISPAGPWLKYRGHLERISDNIFLGALNNFTSARGQVNSPLGQNGLISPAEAAKALQRQGSKWVVIGDNNYGEGSSREHAAMSPRFLGCVAVIAKSFARIAETNLKKQGILPLTFVSPSDYDKIKLGDRLSICGLDKLQPNKSLFVTITSNNAERFTISVKHSLNYEQIEWFKAGSALNAI